MTGQSDYEDVILPQEIKKGRQAYIVAPFIEDSESINGRSAEGLYNAFIKKHPDISCALLHGDLSQNEKDEIMEMKVARSAAECRPELVSAFRVWI